MKQSFGIILALFLIFVIFLIGSTSGYDIGYKKGLGEGYGDGIDKGISWTLDTVKTMLNKQVDSDTIVTRLVVINRDTVTYILSKKTIQHK